MRRLSVLLFAGVLAACGGSALTTTTGGTAVPETTTTGPSPATTEAATTTLPPPTTEAATTTSRPAGVPAAEGLADFFAEAERFDETIRYAADLYNETFDPASGTASPEVYKTLYPIDSWAVRLARLIPGGLDPELETALLAVVADIDSRVAAIAGSIERQGDMDCLALGAESAARFPADLALARSLAADHPTVTVPAADSPEQGMVAVRAAYIHGANTCCDQCGGYVYEQHIEIDWEGRVFGPGSLDAPFEAAFEDVWWRVEFPFAG